MPPDLEPVQTRPAITVPNKCNKRLPCAELPILHYDVGGLSRPSDGECDAIAGTFPGAVSVIEWAEQLREWGAAPEQRLAIYFRRLPSVSGQYAMRAALNRTLFVPTKRLQFVHWQQLCPVLLCLFQITVVVRPDPPLFCLLTLQQPDADVRLLTVVPHTGAWEVRVGLLQANLAIAGPPAGALLALACALLCCCY